MIELSCDVGSLLAVGAVTLVVAFTLWDMRKRLDLTQRRVEYLREEQTRLLAVLREERRTVETGTEQERERHLLEVRWRDERASWEQERLAQELRREREGREREHLARLATEARIEPLEQEIRRLQEARRETSPLLPASPFEDQIEARELTEGEPPTTARETGGAPRPADLTWTTQSKPAKEVAKKDRGRDLGVWHSHPDDGAGKEAAALSGRERRSGRAPIEMFRKHYDRYLENYRGYVELVEDLYRTRDDGEVPLAPLGRREWEGRLRRLKDGIQRTTARLDILEQHNPELATDDRISQRAGVARRHSKLF